MLSLPANAHIVILTGAGISQESGVPTFRDADGLWAKHKLEDVCTPQGFRRDPHLVHTFYNDRRALLKDPAIQPNAAHVAVAGLQRDWRGRVTLITQNIDNLHERSGSADVLHMHGELGKMRCERCGIVYQTLEDHAPETPCPGCARSGGLRPHIVWFNEMPYHMDEIEAALQSADLFVAIGTSGEVYPAAGFVAETRARHIPTIEINLEPSRQARVFTTGFYGLATVEVPKFVTALLEM